MCVAPFEVKLEVAQDAAAGQEGAAHAGEQMPVGSVGGAVGVRHVIALFDQLTVDLVSQRPQVLARLQDPLHDGHGVRNRLHLLQGVEDLDGFVLQAGVTLLFLYWKRQTGDSSSGIDFKQSKVDFGRAVDGFVGESFI